MTRDQEQVTGPASEILPRGPVTSHHFKATVIHHTVLLRWKPTTTPARQAELAAALVALRNVIPEIRAITTGPNLDPASAAEWPFVLEVQVDDLEALKRYADHPAHVAVANELKEAREARLAVDLEV